MEKIEICPNCGHVFEILESQVVKAGFGRCRMCGRKGAPISVGVEEYRNMTFENKPQGSGTLDSKSWLILGALLIVGIFLFLRGDWLDNLCWIAFAAMMGAFYLIERGQLEKKWKKKD